MDSTNDESYCKSRGHFVVSVIIPVYNTEPYINCCLERIAHQSYTNFECIIINDGSTDKSGEICDQFASADQRFKVIHQQNQGLSAARNKGIELAQGEYVCFCDSDDWYHPQYLELLCDALNSHPEASFVLTHRKIVYSYEVTETIKDPNVKILTHSDIFRHMFSDFQYASANCKLIRRSAIEGIRFKDTATEDIDFNMRLYQRVKEFVIVPHVLYFYLQRPGSILHPKNMISRCIAELNGWRDLYHIYFKKECEEHQSYFLERIYKLIISRFNPISDDAEVKESIKLLLDDTIEAFKSNRYISRPMKLICLTCIKQPRLYLAGKRAYGMYYRLKHR